jgi:hypothetical protein
VEFSGDGTKGINRFINQHEFFIYVFDAAPMFVALIVFNMYHPGKVLYGADSEYPKLTKHERRAAREEKKRLNGERKKTKTGGLELTSQV